MQRDQIDIKSKATTEYLQMLIYYKVKGRDAHRPCLYMYAIDLGQIQCYNQIPEIERSSKIRGLCKRLVVMAIGVAVGYRDGYRESPRKVLSPI